MTQGGIELMYSILTTPLMALKKRGYNVDRILNQQREEKLRVQAEVARDREKQAAAAAEAKAAEDAKASSVLGWPQQWRPESAVTASGGATSNRPEGDGAVERTPSINSNGTETSPKRGRNLMDRLRGRKPSLTGSSGLGGSSGGMPGMPGGFGSLGTGLMADAMSRAGGGASGNGGGAAGPVAPGVSTKRVSRACVEAGWMDAGLTTISLLISLRSATLCSKQSMPLAQSREPRSRTAGRRRPRSARARTRIAMCPPWRISRWL